MGMPYDDPDTKLPLLQDVPWLTNNAPEPEHPPRVPMPAAVRERILSLVKSRSVPRE
jgi:hypothetical protein